MVSARAYTTSHFRTLGLDSARVPTPAAPASSRVIAGASTDAYLGRPAANDPEYLPRRSVPSAVEPVATTAWGRALQLVRSWFEPATTAVLLGVGLVPSLLGSTQQVGAAPMPTTPPPEPFAPVGAYADAPAALRAVDASPGGASVGHHEAVATAAEHLFGAPAANDESFASPAGTYALRVANAGRVGLLPGGARLPPLATFPTYGAAREDSPEAGLTRGTRTASPVTPSLAELDARPAAAWSPLGQPSLSRGARGPAVIRLQERLNDLGYNVGTADGRFGRTTRTGVLEFQFDNRDTLRVTGRVDGSTWRALAMGQDVRADLPTHTPGGLRIQPQYRPFARDTVRLFEEAADRAGLPRSWASSPGLHRILDRESDGEVGRLNYTYGSRRERDVHAELRAGVISARSSATGLGQLLLSNVDRYYPSGRAGIGNPVEEATGMLRYIDARYGSPANAWASYGRYHEGY